MSAVRRRPVTAQPAMFADEHLARTTAREAEFVPTPGWVVRALLDVVDVPLDRTPYPEKLKRAHAEGVDVVGPRNAQVLDELPGTVVCAWGPPAWPFVRARAREVVEQLARRDVPLFCLGRSKDGWPRHPLMLSSAAALEPWSMP